MIQDNERVYAALSAVDWISLVRQDVFVTLGWPHTLEKLPAVSVLEAMNTHARHADDRAVMDELQTDIRVFTVDARELAGIAVIADHVMEDELGYRRFLCYEDHGADAKDVRMKLMRYRGYFAVGEDSIKRA